MTSWTGSVRSSLGAVALATAVVTPFFAIACGGNSSNPATSPTSPSSPTTGYQPNTVVTQQPGTAVTPGVPGTAPSPVNPTTPTATPSGAAPLASVNLTDPNALAQLLAQAQAGGAATVTPAGVTGDAVEAGLKLTAQKEAPGMTPAGSVYKGQVAEGGHLQFSFPMQAGTCYTIVGYALPMTVTNVDLNLLAPPLYNVLAGQDVSDNNTPAIGGGGKPMCPNIPMSLTYKVDMMARKGSGVIGAQVYTKPAK